MIRLFVSDIDGCLSDPYRPYDLVRLGELAAYVDRADGGEADFPAVSLCSGRAYPYVEAMVQALGIREPVLFEAGGGMFDPVAKRVHWHPSFTPDVEETVGAVSRWLKAECLPGTAFLYDYGKRTQAGIMGPNPEEVEAYVPVVEAYVARHFPGFCVFHTPVSIDVLPASVTKRDGLAWLASRTGCPLEDMAYIGDTRGDLGALDAVGHSFAPANAGADVRERVAVVTSGRLIDGVLEAYRWCRTYNDVSGKKAI